MFESYLSPFQEPGEEEDTPAKTPTMFKSTTPSKSRAQREADGHGGHGVVRFTKDLSRAYVDVKLGGIDPKTINMFHIHCGVPGVLGPILVDFSLATDIQENFGEDGLFSVEITDQLIVDTVAAGESSEGHSSEGHSSGEDEDSSAEDEGSSEKSKPSKPSKPSLPKPSLPKPDLPELSIVMQRGAVDHPKLELFFDPQTSGGLLFGVAEEAEANEAVERLEDAVVIGEVTERRADGALIEIKVRA